MKNNIMKTINNMYKSTPTLEESELLKLDSLLTRVGGDAKSILLKSEEYTMAEFLGICILNGITFELRKNGVGVEGITETAPASNDNPSPTQSPSAKENSCEEGCVEGESRLTRITLDNWKELLKVGDVIVSFDDNGGSVSRFSWTVTMLEDEEYEEEGFMELNGRWVYFEEDNTCEKGREYYVEV